jgi:hypothetical protein
MDYLNKIPSRDEAYIKSNPLKNQRIGTKRKVPISDKNQSIESTDKFVTARKVIKLETDLANDKLANTLTSVATIMDNNFNNLEYKLAVFIKNNLDKHLNLELKNIKTALDDKKI